MSFQYFSKIRELLDRVEHEEAPHIQASVDLLVTTIQNKATIYVFGASHAGILTQELYYRAGGLMLINPIFAKETLLDVEPITRTSAMERLEGYGSVVAQHTDFQEGDVLIVHSVSGRNPIALDLVLEAKHLGVKIIAVTNVTYSKTATSRHSSQKRLFELADIVLDNHGEIGDAMCEIEGTKQKVGASSTVIGATILNTIIVETVQKLSALGVHPLPIFHSANIDGGDALNRELLVHYQDMIKYKY